ncbi:MAG: hypothetical protein ACRC42_03325 [Mycoplasma sp.]
MAVEQKLKIEKNVIINRPTNVYLLGHIFRKRKSWSPIELYGFAGAEFEEYEYPENIIQFHLTDVGYNAEKSRNAYLDTNLMIRPEKMIFEKRAKKPTREVTNENEVMEMAEAILKSA